MRLAHWIELQFALSHEATEAVSTWLLARGAGGVECVDKTELSELLQAPGTADYAAEDFLQSLSDTVRLRAFFPLVAATSELDSVGELYLNAELDFSAELYDDGPKIAQSLACLEAELAAMLARLGEYVDYGAGYLGKALVFAEDWSENWKRYYHTLHPSPRLVINPSWLDYSPRAGECVLSLDPGMAFGTGSHESTALCLAYLAELEAQDPQAFRASRILDLGCGSGILALAAAKLGSQWVEGIDIDPDAVRIARENAQRNGLGSPPSGQHFSLEAAELKQQPARAYDLICANLIARLHLELAAEYKRKLKPEGKILLAGIIDGQQQLVAEQMQALGFCLLESRCRRDWWTLLLQLPAAE